jgi:hypothetical protein
MIPARRWSPQTDLTSDTAGSGWPTRRRMVVARLPASSSHTAAGVSARMPSSVTVPPRGARQSRRMLVPGCPVDIRLGCYGDSARATTL